MYDLAYIEREMRRLAQAIGTPDHHIPTIGPSLYDARPYIEIDARGYHYVISERGTETERLTTTSIDDLFYRVSRTLAFSAAVAYEGRHRVPGQDFRRVMFARQVELLNRVNPEWAARCASEHEETLRRHPFVDAH